MRPSLLPVIGLAVLAPALAGAAPAESFGSVVRPFLATRCVACHNSSLKGGDLDLVALSRSGVSAQDALAWEKVVLKLKTSEMPPQPLPRPDPIEQAAVVRSVERDLEQAFDAAPPEPGRVTTRRLNRTEYDNTVRDLLGVDIGAAEDFPPDDSGYGFDNIGDVLSLSPALLERYVATAEKVSRAALFGLSEIKPTLTRHPPLGRKIKNVAAPPAEYDVTGLSLPNALHVTKRFPAEGEYKIRVTLGGQRPASSGPVYVGLWLDGKRVSVQELDPDKMASFSIDRHDFAGMMRDFKARIPAGEHWVAATIERLYEGLPADYNGPNPSLKPPPPPREFKPPKDLPPEKIEEIRKNFEARQKERLPANGTRVNLVEISGPFAVAAGPPPESFDKIYACGHRNGRHTAGCDRRILTRLAHRAFRRPVTPQEADRVVALFALGRKDGGSFEQGLALAVQAILVAPDFLFRIERSAGGDTGMAIAPHDLASRLSYFLWSSMPDDELLNAADRGALRDPAVLAAQTRRMLKDAKSEALVQSFGGQWLQFRGLESVRPDLERFPEFDDYLRLSMRKETELFLQNIVSEDRSVVELLSAKYTFLNERLARHYGIAGVSGPEFRRVDTTGTPRTGVLGQASVLTVSSYPTRTSPVLRGKWILSNLLNAPPPDPPAGTPRLDEATISKGASLRQQLEAHRTGTTCSACHSRMDPLGFGLENYDAVGGWREKDGEFAIDANGSLPDGRGFKGPNELAAILESDREEFARGFTAKLLTYALGRGLERYDGPTVKGIAARAAADDYRFSSLVLEIVKSLPFLERRPEGPAS